MPLDCRRAPKSCTASIPVLLEGKGGRGFSFSGGLQNPEGNIIGLGGCALPLPNGGLYFLELVGRG